MVATAIVGSAVVGGVMASESADTAAGAQTDASNAQIAESRRQFDEIRTLMEPFVEGGTSAFGQQQAMLGISGPEAQQAAIDQLNYSPFMAESIRQGENAILQNASATGGLRGGNTQAALAQFRPQLLSQAYDRQFQNLGGLASIGQNAAAGVGNAGMQSTAQINSALQQAGAAQAQGALAQGQAWQNTLGGLTTAAGYAFAPQPATTTGWGGSSLWV